MNLIVVFDVKTTLSIIQFGFFCIQVWTQICKPLGLSWRAGGHFSVLPVTGCMPVLCVLALLENVIQNKSSPRNAYTDAFFSELQSI